MPGATQQSEMQGQERREDSKERRQAVKTTVRNQELQKELLLVPLLLSTLGFRQRFVA